MLYTHTHWIVPFHDTIDTSFANPALNHRVIPYKY